MSPPSCIRPSRESGQASVELLGVLPAVLVVGLVAWQLALAGHALWMGAHAARVAARAEAVGEDAAAAARSALPGRLRRGLRVSAVADGQVRVELRVPLVAGLGPGPAVVATAGLQEQA